MTPETINAFRDIGFAGALIVAVIAFFRGWVVAPSLAWGA